MPYLPYSSPGWPLQTKICFCRLIYLELSDQIFFKKSSYFNEKKKRKMIIQFLRMDKRLELIHHKEGIWKANKSRKRHFTPVVITELHTNTQHYRWHYMWQHCTWNRMARMKKAANSRCWWGSQATRGLQRGWWECMMVQPLGKEFGSGPAITLLAILAFYPRKRAHTDSCMQMLIAILYITF